MVCNQCNHLGLGYIKDQFGVSNLSVFCVRLDDFIQNHVCVLVITSLDYRVNMNCVADE